MCKPALYWIPNKNGCHSLCMGPPAWVDQCTSILQWKTQLKKKPGVMMSVRGWDTCRATLEQFPALGALLCSHPGAVPSSWSPSLLTPWAHSSQLSEPFSAHTLGSGCQELSPAGQLHNSAEPPSRGAGSGKRANSHFSWREVKWAVVVVWQSEMETLVVKCLH